MERQMNLLIKNASRAREALAVGATFFIGYSVLDDCAAYIRGSHSVDVWRYVYAGFWGIAYAFRKWFFSDEPKID
jgi:hypothetical protein